MEKIVIMGGGIAGLSCMNALLDYNVSPLLLEGAQIGTPKMCGEFIGSPAVNVLHQWQIDSVQPIHQAQFFSKNKTLRIDFLQPAGAIARSDAEILLAERARQKGGRIREHALIQKIIPATKKSPYLFYLASGEEIQAKTVIFATGKYGQQISATMPLPYYGIKIHFRHVVAPETLLMQSIPNAYFGIVPISKEASNCACLVKKEVIEKAGSGKQFFYQLVETNPVLQHVFQQINIDHIDWLESRAPYFQRKNLPDWPEAYWIGDAYASLPPAIGSGFSFSLQSAMLAAMLYVQKNPDSYLQKMKRTIRPKLLLGNVMHKLMLTPTFAAPAFSFLQANTWLLDQCLQQLEYRK